MLKGVLFDMDGVLVDSEEYIFEATRMMFAEHGIVVKREDAFPFVGTGENNYITGIGKVNGFEVDIERDKARTYQIYAEITHGKLHALPGVKNFVEKCRQSGFKMAIASSADKVKILINLTEIGFPPDNFHAIVSGLDVEKKKPFPDIYIKAANLLELRPEECLVVEDAISGVRSGKAANCKCLALTTSFSAELLTEADWICNNLADVPKEAISW